MKPKKAVLITGGSRGIGKAIALKLSEGNLPIIINYHSNKTMADEVVNEIRQAGKVAHAIQCDVGDADSVKDMYKEIRSLGFWINIIINNAGVTRDKLAVQMDAESWSHVMRTNLDGTFNCIKPALASMMAHKSGSIVNISSVAGVMGQIGQSNYCASKGAVISLTKSLAREMGSMGIRVNCIAPGFIDTDMVDELRKTPEIKEHLDHVIDNVCSLKRIGKAAEVAEVAYFLASKKSSYINGQTIVVDGGMSM